MDRLEGYGYWLRAAEDAEEGKHWIDALYCTAEAMEHLALVPPHYGDSVRYAKAAEIEEEIRALDLSLAADPPHIVPFQGREWVTDAPRYRTLIEELPRKCAYENDLGGWYLQSPIEGVACLDIMTLAEEDALWYLAQCHTCTGDVFAKAVARVLATVLRECRSAEEFRSRRDDPEWRQRAAIGPEDEVTNHSLTEPKGS